MTDGNEIWIFHFGQMIFVVGNERIGIGLQVAAKQGDTSPEVLHRRRLARASYYRRWRAQNQKRAA